MLYYIAGMSFDPNYLAHHGTKGMQWGVRRYQNADGTLTAAGKEHYRKTVFVSGSSKTQDKGSEYYRRKLPKSVKKELDAYRKNGGKILVGDAPGIDRQVQDYLHKKHYKNVEVYGPGKQVRYSADKEWKTNPIDDPDHEPMSKEWLAKKDIAMTNASDHGLAVILDEGAKATRKNVERLVEQNKDVSVYELNKNGKKKDREVPNSPESLSKSMSDVKYKDFDRLMSPEEVAKARKGSCHDQVMYEYDQLKKMGKNPEATFVIEHDRNYNGGSTHSFVTYKEDGKIKWLENAWGDHKGIKEFNSFNELKKYIKNNYGGDTKKYPYISFYDFKPEKHKPGESLQELLDVVFEK